MAAQLPHVVVLGGGYAGANVAAALDKAGSVRVTLVDRREAMVHKIGGLRGAVDPRWRDVVLVTRENLFKRKGNVVVTGAIASVGEDGKSVTLEDGRTLECDVLVCATGAHNASPGEPPANVTSLADMKESFDNFADAVRRSKRIVIVGGGVVGLELSGELKGLHPEKSVTIIHSGAKFVSREAKKPGESFQTRLRQQLTGLGVEYVMGDRVEGVDFGGAQFLSGERTVRTTSGKEFAVDLVVNCAGTRLNTDMYPASWRDERGALAVDDHLQVKAVGAGNVFALGDLTDKVEPKGAYIASKVHAPVVASNVRAVAAGSKPGKSHKTAPLIMIVSLGPRRGAMSTPIKSFGYWLATKLKSKSLVLELAYRPHGKTPPSVAELNK